MNRDRIQALMDLLEGVPDDKFDMRYLFVQPGGEGLWAGDAPKARLGRRVQTFVKHCGTAACIAGWTAVLADPRGQVADWGSEKAAEYLGISDSQGNRLFVPSELSSPRYTRAAAIATLKHLLETGEVRWPERVDD